MSAREVALDEPRQVGRVVREVAVDRRHELGAGGERALEAGDVGRARGPPCARGGGRRGSRAPRRAGRRARPSRRATRRRSRGRARRAPRSARTRAERAHHRLEVLALVVRGEADDEAHARIIAARAREAADEHRAGRALRAPRRHAGARRRGRVPAGRLPPRGRAHPRVGGPRGAARGRREGDAALRDRRDDRGQDRGGRRDRRHEGAREAARRSCRPGSSTSCTFPGLGPKTARRLWAGARRRRRSTDLRAAAEQQKLRDAPRPRRQERGEGAASRWRRRRRLPRRPAARCSARRSPSCAAPSRRSRRSGLPTASREAGSVRRRAETIEGRRPDRHRDRPGGADRVLLGAGVGGRGGREGRDEGDRRLPRGLPLRPARRPAGVLRQPAPALHRLEGPQRRPARGRGAPGALRQRVRDRRRRGRRDLHGAATRSEVYAHLGYAWIPPELRENRGELEAARDRRAAAPGRARAT